MYSTCAAWGQALVNPKTYELGNGCDEPCTGCSRCPTYRTAVVTVGISSSSHRYWVLTTAYGGGRVSITWHSGKVMAESSIESDNLPPRTHLEITTSAKSLGMTHYSIWDWYYWFRQLGQLGSVAHLDMLVCVLDKGIWQGLMCSKWCQTRCRLATLRSQSQLLSQASPNTGCNKAPRVHYRK